MGRGILFLLIFGSIGMGAIMLHSHLEAPTPGLVGGRAGLLQQAEVAPLVAPKGRIADPGSPTQPAQSVPQPKALPATLPEPVPRGSGLLVRAPIQIANLVKCKNLEEVIEKYARQYGVDEELVWAVIRQESGFNPGAVSPKGAMGLMQLMPRTAALLGVSDPFDVEQNVAGGVKYLEQCLNQFNHNVPLALAAYNAGPGNVVKYQGCPPFAETRNYVATILAAYAGESIRADWQLCRVNYAMDEESAAPVRLRGLPWRIPLPNWKIATPRCKLDAPNWKATLRPF